MRKTILAFILAGSFALAGCQTNGTTPSITTSDVNNAITTVQQDAIRVCGFLPAAQVVANILATFVSSTAPVITIANTIATGICNQVAPKASSKRRATIPAYRGVTIQGEFVR